MNRTVERTFAILQLVANSDQGITLQEIADRMDMAKSSAFVIVHSLLQLNYIRTVENNDKKYCLGIETFSLGMKYVNDQSIVKQSSNFLPAIAEKYGRTAFVGVLNGSKVVYLYKYVAQKARLATCSIGASKEAYATALGKAIIAYLPQNKQNEIVSSIEFKPFTEFTITNRERFVEELKITRMRGYALECRELENITECCAAPIFDYTGEVVAAISLSDFYNENNGNHDELKKDIILTAAEISRSLGYFAVRT